MADATTVTGTPAEMPRAIDSAITMLVDDGLAAIKMIFSYLGQAVVDGRTTRRPGRGTTPGPSPEWPSVAPSSMPYRSSP